VSSPTSAPNAVAAPSASAHSAADTFFVIDSTYLPRPLDGNGESGGRGRADGRAARALGTATAIHMTDLKVLLKDQRAARSNARATRAARSEPRSATSAAEHAMRPSG